MLIVFQPSRELSGAFVATAGAQTASPEVLMLNILIELRVMNALFFDGQRGLVTQTVEQYRSDVVNEIAQTNAVTTVPQ